MVTAHCVWCRQPLVKTGAFWESDRGGMFCLDQRVHKPDPQTVRRVDPQPGRTA